MLIIECIVGILQHAGVLILGQHVQEVLSDELGIDVHVQRVLILINEIPAVLKLSGAGRVIHEDLVQGLQWQVAAVCIRGGAVCLCPLLRDEGLQDIGIDHLTLDLVTILDEGHREGAAVLQGIGGELLEDLVVLRLLPLELHVVVRIDGLQIGDKQWKCGLTTRGVTYAVEGLAVRLFDGLLCELLHGHAFGFLDDGIDTGEVLFLRRLGFRRLFGFRLCRFVSGSGSRGGCSVV